jgi:hypothetical protein
VPNVVATFLLTRVVGIPGPLYATCACELVMIGWVAWRVRDPLHEAAGR